MNHGGDMAQPGRYRSGCRDGDGATPEGVRGSSDWSLSIHGSEEAFNQTGVESTSNGQMDRFVRIEAFVTIPEPLRDERSTHAIMMPPVERSRSDPGMAPWIGVARRGGNGSRA